MMENALKASKRLLDSTRPLIFGMVHVPALPGTPQNRLKINEISSKVTKETQQYAKAKVDGIIFENMHDLPYLLAKDLGPETVSAMTRVCVDAVNNLGKLERDQLLLGIQILASGNREALSVAQSAELDFIRSEAFIFGHLADEGYMDACAGALLRYRKQIGAGNIAIFADIKKKHSSHAITSDISIGETAQAAQFFLADGLIVTGNSTGSSANPNDFKEVQKASNLPTLIGSGITSQNHQRFIEAHGFIVGSYFKKDGQWKNELDLPKISNFTSLIRGIKRNV